MKKKYRGRFRSVTGWLLTLSLLMGQGMSVLAGGEEAGESEIELTVSDDYGLPESGNAGPDTEDEELLIPEEVQLEDDNDPVEENTGYLEAPDEHELLPVDTGLSYSEMMDRLVDGDDVAGVGQSASMREERPDGSLASAADAAFPADHNSDWLSYFKDRYPATRDQNPFGTCWAHSSIGLSEFYMINHGMADKSVDLSELHLVYWNYTKDSGSPAGDTGDGVQIRNNDIRYIFDGGNLEHSINTLMHQRGLAAESTAPYKSLPSKSEISGWEGLDAATERNDVAWMDRGYRIGIKENPMQVKEAIIRNGAVGISFYVAGRYYDKNSNSYYCYDMNSTNHAVMVVGWDDDFPRGNFERDGNVPSKNGAWLIRNSYSTVSKADYDSYMWLSYEDSSITGGFAFEVTDRKPCDNNYYYDSQIHWTGAPSYNGAERCYTANVFTASGNSAQERLNAVSFQTSSGWVGGTGYTVYIYTDLTDPENPISGTLQESATTSGTVYYKGQYTVNLKDSVLLDKGERFSVVICSECPYTVASESALTNWPQIASSSVSAAPGQSFCIDSLDKEWCDYGAEKGRNFVISALTYDVTGTEAEQGSLIVNPVSANFTVSGQSIQLYPTLLDRYGRVEEEAEMSYTSSDTGVVTVDESGLMSCVANGTAKVTVSSSGLSAVCSVSVDLTEKIVGDPYRIRLSQSSFLFERLGQERELSAVVLDKDNKRIDDAEVTFTSSDPVAVSLTTTGRNSCILKGSRSGAGKITAECSGVSANASFMADIFIPLEGMDISLSGNNVLHPGDELWFETEFYPDYASDKKVQWTYESSLLSAEETDEGLHVKALWPESWDEEYIGQPRSLSTDVVAVSRDGGHRLVRTLWIVEENDYVTACFAEGDSYTYTGSAICPKLKVFRGDKELREGVDYSVKYKNNVKASADAEGSKRPCAVITGKTVAASKTLYFDILPRSLEDSGVYVTGLTVKSGSAFTPGIYYNGRKLSGRDFEFANPAMAKERITVSRNVVLRGKGNFAGERTVTVFVEADLLKIRVEEFSPKLRTYNAEMQPLLNTDEQSRDCELIVNTAKGVLPLKEGVDYMVLYPQDMKNAGKKTVHIVGIGSYSGSVSKSFNVLPATELKSFSAKVIGSTSYNGTAVKPELEVSCELGGERITLVEGSDYSVSYSNNKKAGSKAAVAKLKFMGNFKGAYKGANSKKLYFQVRPADIAAAEVKAADKVLADAKAVKLAPVFFAEMNGRALKSRDYRVTKLVVGSKVYGAKDRIKASDLGGLKSVSAQIFLEGQGNYCGTVSGEFMLKDISGPGGSAAVDLSKAKVKLVDASGKKLGKQAYTGDRVYLPADCRMELTVKYAGKSYTLKEGIDFERILKEDYVNNVEKGKAYVLIRGMGEAGAGELHCYGAKSISFNIGKGTFQYFVLH